MKYRIYKIEQSLKTVYEYGDEVKQEYESVFKEYDTELDFETQDKAIQYLKQNNFSQFSEGTYTVLPIINIY